MRSGSATATLDEGFEDAIQLYSALHARADFLLTRNVGDFPAGTLPILTPDEFLALPDHARDRS